MSSTCQNYVVRSNSWQFRPWTLSLRAHTASRCPFALAVASQLHHIIRHHSQEFDPFRLQLHHIIRYHSQEFNLFRLHLCRALSCLAAAAGVTQQRWLNTCCQTCITSRRLCPSRLDTSHTALNTCNIDTTLKKPPRWGLLKHFSDLQDTCIQQQLACVGAKQKTLEIRRSTKVCRPVHARYH